MPFLTIAFPVFDPIAISIGPIAIRWYALAYIGGIVLGWIYARSLLKNEKLWGGPAPISLPQLDDFILWVTVGIIVGGRTGYVLFYNLAFFIQHPAEIFELWKGGMSFHGGFLGCVAAVILFCRVNKLPILSLGDITTAVGPIGLFLGRLANFINSELWGRPADSSVPWAMVDGRPEASRPDPWQLHRDLRFCAHHRRILQRTRPPARIFVGRAHHGYAAVGADDYSGRHHYCVGMAPRCAEA